jgi:predicted alpha/beta-fold hydrolase
MKSEKERIDEAVALAVRYGGIDGAHHKTWVIDQMVRVLAGDEYQAVVADARAGADGPETYDWEIDIAP